MTMPASVHTRPDHDETLIARLAADDVSTSEAAQAQQLVASCPACAELHADLRSIMAATAGLPAPKRTRDFQLTAADVARLRGTGWRRLLGRFGDPRLAFTRPLATGLVTLGIAGLVLASLPSLLSSATATGAPAVAPVAGNGSESLSSQPGTDAFGSKSGGAASAIPGVVSSGPAVPAASTAAATSVPQDIPLPTGSSPAYLAASATPTDLTAALPTRAAASAQLPPDDVPGAKIVEGSAPSAGPSALLVASIALLLVGIALLLLRWVARRPA